MASHTSSPSTRPSRSSLESLPMDLDVDDVGLSMGVTASQMLSGLPSTSSSSASASASTLASHDVHMASYAQPDLQAQLEAASGSSMGSSGSGSPFHSTPSAIEAASNSPLQVSASAAAAAAAASSVAMAFGDEAPAPVHLGATALPRFSTLVINTNGLLQHAAGMDSRAAWELPSSAESAGGSASPQPSGSNARKSRRAAIRRSHSNMSHLFATQDTIQSPHSAPFYNSNGVATSSRQRNTFYVQPESPITARSLLTSAGPSPVRSPSISPQIRRGRRRNRRSSQSWDAGMTLMAAARHAKRRSPSPRTPNQLSPSPSGYGLVNSVSVASSVASAAGGSAPASPKLKAKQEPVDDRNPDSVKSQRRGAAKRRVTKQDRIQHNKEEYRRRARLRNKFSELRVVCNSEKKDRYNILCKAVDRLNALNAEVAIAKGEAHLGMPSARLTLDTCFLDCNEQMVQVLGLPREQILNTSLTTLVHPEHLPHVCVMLETILSGSLQHWEGEVVLLLPNSTSAMAASASSSSATAATALRLLHVRYFCSFASPEHRELQLVFVPKIASAQVQHMVAGMNPERTKFVLAQAHLKATQASAHTSGSVSSASTSQQMDTSD